MKKLILTFALPILIFTEGVSQKPNRIEEEVAEIIIWSSRLDLLDSVKIDSFRQIALTLGNSRLRAYNDFLEKIWRWRMGKNTPEAKAQLEGEIDNIAETSAYLDLRGHAFFSKGMIMFYNREYSKSLVLIYKGRRLLEEAHFEQSQCYLDYLKGFFDVYYYFEDFKTAAQYCELALQQAEVEGHTHYNHYNYYNDLGMSYLKMKEYDKAEQAFKAGIESCKKHKNQSFEALINSNIGSLERLRGNFRAALPHYYAEIQINEKDIPESVAYARVYLAFCLLQLDSVEKAAQYLAYRLADIPAGIQTSYHMQRYQTLALYYSKTNNFALASQYKDSFMIINDTIRARKDYKKLTVLESSLQAEKYLAERKILENERFWRNVIIVFLLLIFSGIVYWLIQKRRQDRLLEEQKRQRAEEMLVHANQQLTQYLSNIREKNDLIENMRQQLDSLTANSKLSEAEKASYLANMQNSTLLTESDWLEFKNLFERVFPNFFTHLKANYTELNPAEIRLLALENLDLNDKDRGNMLGISADSVRKSRYRLRKKYPELLEDNQN